MEMCSCVWLAEVRGAGWVEGGNLRGELVAGLIHRAAGVVVHDVWIGVERVENVDRYRDHPLKGWAIGRGERAEQISVDDAAGDRGEGGARHAAPPRRAMSAITASVNSQFQQGMLRSSSATGPVASGPKSWSSFQQTAG